MDATIVLGPDQAQWWHLYLGASGQPEGCCAREQRSRDSGMLESPGSIRALRGTVTFESTHPGHCELELESPSCTSPFVAMSKLLGLPGGPICLRKVSRPTCQKLEVSLLSECPGGQRDSAGHCMARRSPLN